MKIKKQYHDRVITLLHPFIPGGEKKRLGDLKATEVRALYNQGLIEESLLEPKKTKTKEDAQDNTSTNTND